MQLFVIIALCGAALAQEFGGPTVGVTRPLPAMTTHAFVPATTYPPTVADNGVYTCRCGFAVDEENLKSEVHSIESLITHRRVDADSCIMAERTCYNYCHAEGMGLGLHTEGGSAAVNMSEFKSEIIDQGFSQLADFADELSGSTIGDVICSVYGIGLSAYDEASLVLKGDVAECSGSLKKVFVVEPKFCCNNGDYFLSASSQQEECKEVNMDDLFGTGGFNGGGDFDFGGGLGFGGIPN